MKLRSRRRPKLPALNFVLGILTLAVTFGGVVIAYVVNTDVSKTGRFYSTVCIFGFEKYLNRQCDSITWIKTGDEAFAEEDYKKAIENYDAALAIDPNSAQAYNQRGYAKIKIGNFTRALADFDAAIKLNPQEPSLYANRGFALASSQRREDAIAALTTAIDLEKSTGLMPADLIARGRTYLDMGKYEEAIKDFNEIMWHANDDIVGLRFLRAQAYFMQNDLESAILDYDDVIVHLSANIGAAAQCSQMLALAHFGRGQAFYHSNETDRALSDFEEALKFNPRLSLAHKGKGWIFEDRKDYDRAVAEYSLAIDLDGKDADAFETRSSIYEHQGKHDKALEDINRALEIDSLNSEYFAMRSVIEANLSRIEQAAEDINKSLSISNDNSVANLVKGMLNFLDRNKQKVFSEFDATVSKTNRKDGLALAGRCMALASQGNHVEALKDCESALVIDPDNLIALEGSCFSKLVAGDKNALKDCDKAVIASSSQEIGRTTMLALRGLARLEFGDLDAALDDETSALRYGDDNRGNVLAHCVRGFAYLVKNDAVRALDDAQEALRTAGEEILACPLNLHAEISVRSKKYEDAIADWRKCVKIGSANRWTLPNIAIAHAAKRDYDQAFNDAEEARRTNAFAVNAFTGIGHFAEVNGDLDYAIQSYSKLVELAPQSADGFRLRGLACAKQRSTKKSDLCKDDDLAKSRKLTRTTIKQTDNMSTGKSIGLPK